VIVQVVQILLKYASRHLSPTKETLCRSDRCNITGENSVRTYSIYSENRWQIGTESGVAPVVAMHVSVVAAERIACCTPWSTLPAKRHRQLPCEVDGSTTANGFTNSSTHRYVELSTAIYCTGLTSARLLSTKSSGHYEDYLFSRASQTILSRSLLYLDWKKKEEL